MVQISFSIREAPCLASFTFSWRPVGAIEIWYVLISDISEPVQLLLLLEMSQRNAMNRCVTPALIEETACTVQVFKVFCVDVASPKVEISNLKI